MEMLILVPVLGLEGNCCDEAESRCLGWRLRGACSLCRVRALIMSERFCGGRAPRGGP